MTPAEIIRHIFASELEYSVSCTSHHWDAGSGMNVYTFAIDDQAGNRVGYYSTSNKRLDWREEMRYLTRDQNARWLWICRELEIIPEPEQSNWRVGDALNSDHPWRAKPKQPNHNPALYRSRAKPLERNRLEIRLRDETRLAINTLMADTGWTATEVVEYAVRRLESLRRVTAPLPAEIASLNSGNSST